MPNILTILGKPVESAVEHAIAAVAAALANNQPPPVISRTFELVTQNFPLARDSGNTVHSLIAGANPLYVLSGAGAVVSSAKYAEGMDPPPGPYRFITTIPLTDGAKAAVNPFFSIDAAAEPKIIGVTRSATVVPTLSFTVPEVQGSAADLAPTYPGLDGTGIIVGFIDYGFDFAHLNFIKKQTGAPVTRLLALWDQNEGANLGVNTALDQLKPTGGWSKDYSKSYIYSPSGTFLAVPAGTPWSGGKPGINSRLSLDDPYAGYYDPHLNYFIGAANSTTVADKEGAHGTHVADIAVGNGVATGRPGIAPAADILFVQLRPPSLAAGPPDVASVLDAVHFIAAYAEKNSNRPAVINLCVNTNASSHEASANSDVTMLDHYVQGTSGRGVTQAIPIVISAGNQFVLSRAQSKLTNDMPGDPWKKNYRETMGRRLRITAAKDNEVQWLMRAGDTTLNELEIWYQTVGGVDTVTVVVSSRLWTPANNAIQTPALAGSDIPIPLTGATMGHIRARDPVVIAGSTPRHLRIEMDPATFPGGTNEVLITVALKSTTTKRVHVWVQREDINGQSALAVRTKDLDTIAQACTLGLLSCGAKTIAVGAYFAPDRTGNGTQIAEFSSAGPAVNYVDLDGTTPDSGEAQPLVSAPGVIVLAARSKGGRTVNNVTREPACVMSGTSMAAPHVSGTVALMLQRNLGATPAALRIALRGSARHDRPWNDPNTIRQDPVNPWNRRFGYGRLDVRGAIDKI